MTIDIYVHELMLITPEFCAYLDWCWSPATKGGFDAGTTADGS